MIIGYNPINQALLGTFFTWGVTALGSSMVFFIKGDKKILDAGLGFAGGVMLAATYWSLLDPAVEAAKDSYLFNHIIFLPVALGFFLGAIFVLVVDHYIPDNYYEHPSHSVSNSDQNSSHKQSYLKSVSKIDINSDGVNDDTIYSLDSSTNNLHKRSVPSISQHSFDENHINNREIKNDVHQTWRRLMMLIIAITLHNIPEGMAVGVGFASINKTKSSTFSNARNLAIGIGIQNFPEGLAVSLPLRASGMSAIRSFWYGQLSGLVEPIAGIFGAYMVILIEPLLSVILAFAAGAMIYVIVDDIIPEGHTGSNGKLTSFSSIIGFIVMMCLDIALD